MKHYFIFLIIGVLLFSWGGYQSIQYEEHSLSVTATITDIKTTDETDDGPISYKHTFYGDYTVNGIQHTHKKLTTQHTGSLQPKLSVGDTVEIRVNIDDPGARLSDGSLFMFFGMGFVLLTAVSYFKRKTAQ